MCRSRKLTCSLDRKIWLIDHSKARFMKSCNENYTVNWIFQSMKFCYICVYIYIDFFDYICIETKINHEQLYSTVNELKIFFCMWENCIFFYFFIYVLIYSKSNWISFANLFDIICWLRDVEHSPWNVINCQAQNGVESLIFGRFD